MRLREQGQAASGRIRLWVERTKRATALGYAGLLHQSYAIKYKAALWRARHRGLVAAVTLLVLFGGSLGFIVPLQSFAELHFPTEARFSELRALLVQLGGSLLGAAAIVSSLVMFAMQVNIERMPHGLFRRLSSDLPLLAAFACSFLLAIAVAALSLAIEKPRLAVILLAAAWGTLLILLLFLYAYRRALLLVSPLQQLGLVVQDARRELQIWSRRASRARPLLEQHRSSRTQEAAPGQSTHDLARTAYFRLNPGWTQGTDRAIRHAVSFARRYAEQGDYEVSAAALNAMVTINASYIEAKGKTFYANVLLVDNPFSTDGFINGTLECLRQNVRSGVARGDEQQIEQTLRAMAALVGLYLAIDYSTEYASKTHAHLASGYLSDAVHSIVPHNMADVLMEGVRLMGQSARLFLEHGKAEDIAVLSEKIALVACVGIAREDHRPVTLASMEQLANLTFDLLRLKTRDIHFAVSEIRQDVSFVTKLFLAVPDTPLRSVHSTYLAPYYSGTSPSGLQARIIQLADALLAAKPDDENAKSVIHNLERWAEDLHQTEKENLLAAIKAKSGFTLDVIHWVAQVTKILLAVSNAPACEGHDKEELQRHARWLISVLSWIPDEPDPVAFVESYDLTETLFEAAMDAHGRGCVDIASDIGEMLLSWAFKAGKHERGWGTLQRALCGSATLAVAQGNPAPTELLNDLSGYLAKPEAPEQEIRDRAARELHERAAELHREGHWSSAIEQAISRADHVKLRPLLEAIAMQLSPSSRPAKLESTAERV